MTNERQQNAIEMIIEALTNCMTTVDNYKAAAGEELQVTVAGTQSSLHQTKGVWMKVHEELLKSQSDGTE